MQTSASPAPLTEQPEDYEARALKAREIFSSLDGVRLPDQAEDELTRLFTIAYAIDLKHVAAWGKWLWWDGARWRVEQTRLAFDLARKVCRAQAKLLQKDKQAEKDKIATAIASAATVAAVVRLASADREHAVTPEQLDTDGFLLNTPGGTVDLRKRKRYIKGTFRAGTASELITMVAVLGKAKDSTIARTGHQASVDV